jgi:RNA polymerase sigma-70 factor (ECF subfamily)
MLERLKVRDAEAWRRLVRLYYPLVRAWSERLGLRGEDAADVAQEVFRALAGGLERFERDDGKNSFRGWLFGITRRQALAFYRQRKEQPAGAGGTEAQRRFAELPAEELDESSAAELVSERQSLLQRALVLLQHDVEPHTWQAFWRAAVEGHAPNDIAADLGISVNAVYLAKARMLRRLRAEFTELLE